MSARRVDPARSRIVLVGVSAYTDASIPDEPAIANNIADLVSVLTDPALGAFPSEHLLVAPDPGSNKSETCCCKPPPTPRTCCCSTTPATGSRPRAGPSCI